MREGRPRPIRTAVKSCPAAPPRWSSPAAPRTAAGATRRPCSPLIASSPPGEEVVLCSGRDGPPLPPPKATMPEKAQELPHRTRSKPRDASPLSPPARPPPPALASPAAPPAKPAQQATTNSASIDSEDKGSMSRLLQNKQKELQKELLRLQLQAKEKQLAQLRSKLQEKSDAVAEPAPAPAADAAREAKQILGSPVAAHNGNLQLRQTQLAELRSKLQERSAAAATPEKGTSPALGPSPSPASPASALRTRSAQSYEERLKALGPSPSPSSPAALRRGAVQSHEERLKEQRDLLAAAVARRKQRLSSEEPQRSSQANGLGSAGGCRGSVAAGAGLPQSATFRAAVEVTPAHLSATRQTSHAMEDTVLVVDSDNESAPAEPARPRRSRSRSLSLGGASDDSEVQRRWRAEEALWRQDAQARGDGTGAAAAGGVAHSTNKRARR